jgi:hypothetical protein
MGNTCIRMGYVCRVRKSFSCHIREAGVSIVHSMLDRSGEYDTYWLDNIAPFLEKSPADGPPSDAEMADSLNYVDIITNKNNQKEPSVGLETLEELTPEESFRKTNNKKRHAKRKTRISHSLMHLNGKTSGTTDKKLQQYRIMGWLVHLMGCVQSLIFRGLNWIRARKTH